MMNKYLELLKIDDSLLLIDKNINNITDWYVGTTTDDNGNVIYYINNYKELKDDELYAPYGAIIASESIFDVNKMSCKLLIIEDESYDSIKDMAYQYFNDERDKREKGQFDLEATEDQKEALYGHYNKTFAPIFIAGFRKALEILYTKEDLINIIRQTERRQENFRFLNISDDDLIKNFTKIPNIKSETDTEVIVTI